MYTEYSDKFSLIIQVHHNETNLDIIAVRKTKAVIIPECLSHTVIFVDYNHHNNAFEFVVYRILWWVMQTGVIQPVCELLLAQASDLVLPSWTRLGSESRRRVVPVETTGPLWSWSDCDAASSSAAQHHQMSETYTAAVADGSPFLCY